MYGAFCTIGRLLDPPSAVSVPNKRHRLPNGQLPRRCCISDAWEVLSAIGCKARSLASHHTCLLGKHLALGPCGGHLGVAFIGASVPITVQSKMQPSRRIRLPSLRSCNNSEVGIYRDPGTRLGISRLPISGNIRFTSPCTV